jgi:hypothetical protein
LKFGSLGGSAEFVFSIAFVLSSDPPSPQPTRAAGTSKSPMNVAQMVMYFIGLE